jgi:hypothetical protein
MLNTLAAVLVWAVMAAQLQQQDLMVQLFIA